MGDEEHYGERWEKLIEAASNFQKIKLRSHKQPLH